MRFLLCGAHENIIPTNNDKKYYYRTIFFYIFKKKNLFRIIASPK